MIERMQLLDEISHGDVRYAAGRLHHGTQPFPRTDKDSLNWLLQEQLIMITLGADNDALLLATAEGLDLLIQWRAAPNGALWLRRYEEKHGGGSDDD